MALNGYLLHRALQGSEALFSGKVRTFTGWKRLISATSGSLKKFYILLTKQYFDDAKSSSVDTIYSGVDFAIKPFSTTLLIAVHYYSLSLIILALSPMIFLLAFSSAPSYLYVLPVILVMQLMCKEQTCIFFLSMRSVFMLKGQSS